MLVVVCTDGVLRVGDGGGMTRYDTVDEIAGAEHCLHLDMSVDRVTAAFNNLTETRWQRLRRKFFG